MPNQPAPGTTYIHLRVTEDLKQAILDAVDRINTTTPAAANATMSSWIKMAIENELKRSKKNKQNT